MSVKRMGMVIMALGLVAVPQLMAAGNDQGTMNQAFNSEEIRAPLGAYSHGVKIPPNARWLVTAGQAGSRPDGTAPKGIEAQAQQALANVHAILRTAGMDWPDVVKLNVFMTDRGDVSAWSRVRGETLGPARPAGTLLVVKSLVEPEWLIEIEATAAKTSAVF